MNKTVKKAEFLQLMGGSQVPDYGNRVWARLVRNRPVTVTSGRPEDLQIVGGKLRLNIMDPKGYVMFIHEVAHVVEVPDERLDRLGFGMYPAGSNTEGLSYEAWEWDAEQRVLAIHHNLGVFFGLSMATFLERSSRLFSLISGRHQAFISAVKANVSKPENSAEAALAEYDRKMTLIRKIEASGPRRPQLVAV